MTSPHFSRSSLKKQWPSRLFSGKSGRHRHGSNRTRRRTLRLLMEQLEDRRMLAVTIDSNHLQPGIDYTITDSESITIKDNVVIDTSSPGGKAGIIKLNAPVIHLGDNVTRPAGGANHSAYAFLQFSPREIAAQSETPTEATNATVPASPSLRRALPDDAALTADEVFGDLHRWVSSQKARTVHTLSAHVGTEIEELESAIDDLVETVAQGWHGTRN